MISPGKGSAYSLSLKTQNFQVSVEMFARLGYFLTASPARNGVRSSNSASTAWPKRGGTFQEGIETQSGTSFAEASTAASLSP
ncbi:hypothetical protein D3C74_433600 [compost metagenome]